MGNEQSQNGREEYQIDEITHANGAYSKCVHMRTRGRERGGGGVEKLVIRYVRTTWMAPNKCCENFFVHWSGQVHSRASAPARKMSFFSSIIITIVLSYAIIRIYIILHIYL